MLVFPAMLVPAAEQAGMKVPDNTNHYEKYDFPHFAVFCQLQLNRTINQPGEQFGNAVVIAAMPELQVILATLDDFRDAGVVGI